MGRYPLRRGIAALLVWCLVCGCRDGFAQTPNGRESLSRDYASDILNEAVNTNTLFASQDVISNGRFLKRRQGQPDTKYEMFRLPAEFSLGSKGDTVRPFVRGMFGALRATSGVAPVEGGGQSDFSVTELFSVTSGIGCWIQLTEGLSVAPAALVSYTHLSNAYDFNNSFSQDVLRRQYGDFYNWNLDVLTYIPSFRAVYEGHIGDDRWRNTVSVSQLLNDSVHTTSDSAQINSASGIVSNRIEYQRSLGVSVGSATLALQPFFQWSNISGKAASGLSLVNLFEVGADVLSLLKEPWLIFSEVYVGASYVSGDNFEGYHIGIGAHV